MPIFARIVHNIKGHWYHRYLPGIDVTGKLSKKEDGKETEKIV